MLGRPPLWLPGSAFAVPSILSAATALAANATAAARARGLRRMCVARILSPNTVSACRPRPRKRFTRPIGCTPKCERSQDPCVLNVVEVCGDLPGRQAPGSQREHDLIDPVQAPFALGHDHRLETASKSSRRIGMAMGILMAQFRIRPEQAFDMLRDASRRRTADCATWPRKSSAPGRWSPEGWTSANRRAAYCRAVEAFVIWSPEHSQPSTPPRRRSACSTSTVGAAGLCRCRRT